MADSGVTEIQDKFCYVHSCDVDAFLEIKIGTLEGKKNQENYKELLEDPQLKFTGLNQSSCPDLFATITIYNEGKPMFMSVRTAYKAFSTRWNWNEWVQLPIKYQDLPRNAELDITIWDIYDCSRSIAVGGTSVSIFGKHGTLRQGIHDLRVWPGKIACSDGSTPGKVEKGTADEMSKLAKLSKKHHKGRLMKVDWLDRLTFREIEMVNEREKKTSNFFYLMIEFPRVIMNSEEYSIVYFERDADQHSIDVQLYPEIVTVPDDEVLKENLVETKHHRLTRSIRSGTMTRDLKPNAAKRDLLTKITDYPSTTVLTSEEMDCVWQFRFYLTNQRKALLKFLKCINWNHSQESKQAVDMLNRWEPIDAIDALELLTPQYTNKKVRQYAVSRLRHASDEDILLYLLQLVQALRYDFPQTSEAEKPAEVEAEHSILNEDLPPIDKHEDVLLEDSLYEAMEENENAPVNKDPLQQIEQSVSISKTVMKKEEESDLASLLVDRACTNDRIANFFYWYLLVECKDDRNQKAIDMYTNIMRRFSKALLNGNHDCRRRRNMLGREQKFLDKITEVVKQIQQFSGNRKKKIEKLQQLLDTPDFNSFEPLPLPLDPDVKVKGIISQKASIFKSAMMPIKITFRTLQNREYVAIFKNGDDLRQDQLVLQIITLMNKLLMRENLDLKLTPYNVLATSISQGLVQFIDSQAVAQILRDDGSIQNYFRKESAQEGAPYGIHPTTMDNYVKSCAGYCVITYILGVGDRHLDNLMLTNSGNLFHIDFGYILGRDPKPFPPPMKLSKEMVEGMGGTTSEHYQQFRKLCFTAFLHLRRYANLFLNLFSLLVDASVPDIALEPDKTVKKVQDKFRLDLNDEEAVQYLQTLIDESVSAVFASLAEQVHKIAQYWRR